MDTALRGVVIRCLGAICESGQQLTDLFVNYDCDLEGANLFERMVLALVRLAQGPSGQEAPGGNASLSPDEQAIRMSVSGLWICWLGGMQGCGRGGSMGRCGLCPVLSGGVHHYGAVQ